MNKRFLLQNKKYNQDIRNSSYSAKKQGNLTCNFKLAKSSRLIKGK